MYRRLFLIVLWVIAHVSPAQSQSCSISVSSHKGCIPHPVNFDVTTTGSFTVKAYDWDFGDGTPHGTQKDPGHVYNKRGTFQATVRITFTDGSTCTEKSKPIKIFDNPKADFNVKQNSEVILCNQGDKFCFHDLSFPGADGAPINGWVWDFGDGGLSTDKDPCYAYSNSGTYVVSLEARDTNGCKKLIQKTLQVKFAAQMNLIPKVKFTAKIKYNCPLQKAELTFTNITDTVGYGIKKFTWNFDDGTKADCDLSVPACLNEWLSQKHAYSTTGSFKPSLTVETRYGCKATYYIDTAIYLDPYILKIKISPQDTLCHGKDSVIQFQATSHLKAAYYIWDYGDPYDTDVGRLPFAQHTYSHPGTYTIRFRTKVYDDCIYDTTFCHKVTMLGPHAWILQGSYTQKPWDSIPKYGTGLVAKKDYPSYFDTNCYAPAYVTYYTYDTTVIKNGDTTFTHCGTPFTYATDSVYDECLHDTIAKKTPQYKPKVASVKDKIEVKGNPAFWAKDSPWPKEPVYSAPPFVNDPLKMDDTALFACGSPHRITFTNFSTKFRGRDAIDDLPLQYPDTCINPSYPYASDSLRFEWDFGEGDPVTSTEKNKNERARFSTERLPTHLFTKAGCYWVRLITYDPVTGCSDNEEIPVIIQAPDAGWDPVYGNRITWLEQEKAPANPRPRGVRVTGLPCKDELQGIDFGETKPLCYKRDISFIPDSAAFSQKAGCDTSKVLHNWIRNDELIKKMALRYEYKDTGWKTIGAVVTNVAGCSDTTWYHNYKYIHGIFPNLVLDKKQICIGEQVRVTPALQDQVGIKLLTMIYIVEADKNDVLMVRRDTFQFRTIGPNNDTATTTVHEPEWGIDDPPGLNFNYLRDTLSMVIDTPGHVTLWDPLESTCRHASLSIL